MKKLLEYRFLPVIVVICLFLVYSASDMIFVKCKWFGLCQELVSTNISRVSETNKDLKLIPEELNTKSADLELRLKRVKDEETEIEKTQTAIDLKKQEINVLGSVNAAAANTGAGNSAGNTANTTTAAANPNPDAAKLKTLMDEKSKLDKTLENQKAELKGLSEARDKARGDILGISKQISARYSFRLTWVFLTAIFFLLCAGAIWISVSTIRECVESAKQTKWLSLTTAVAVIFAAAVFFSVFVSPKSNYLSIVYPLFSQSLDKFGDLSFHVINFFNVIGFAATIFLVSASSAILNDVLRKKNANAAVVPPLTAEDFECDDRNLKTILYIGALMLFVGMLRTKLVADWHLIFISIEQTDDFYKLLADFFKSSIGVQAGFYTILLAVIYLPVAYAIPPKITTGTPPPGLLQKLGLPFEGDFMPRLISVISPFLAGPMVDLFKFFVGK